MLLDRAKIKTERLNRAWSQAQLAEISGVGLRTIQRIEAEGKSSLESTKALASVFCLSVTELYLADKNVTIQASSEQIKAEYFSAQAKTVATSLFFISTIVVLFLQWSKLPELMWINQLRDQIFSEQMAPWLKSFISVVIAIFNTLAFSLIVAGIYDLIRNDGFYSYVKRQFKLGHWSMKKSTRAVFMQVKILSNGVVRPIAFTIIFFTLLSAVIYLDMEDYQKDRMATFLNLK